ncbi:HIT family protein [Streptomyces sp. NPDC054933]
MNCIFCAIATGEATAHRVFEDETTVAFLDARPLFPGHVLVVPKRHVETLLDLPEAEVGPFFTRVRLITGGGGARHGSRWFVCRRQQPDQPVGAALPWASSSPTAPCPQRPRGARPARSSNSTASLLRRMAPRTRPQPGSTKLAC